MSLNGLDRDHWQTIASSIGGQLTRLSLIGVSAEHISTGDLKFCISLEELEIPGLILPTQIEPLDQLMKEIDNFLPNLKKFKSSSCLGVYSFLFEQKKSLTHLDLHCSHISTTASKLNWMEISYWWENLQELSIGSTAKLSPNSLFVIVPRLRKLKSLTFSNQMLMEDDRTTAAEDFIPKLKNKSSCSNISISMSRPINAKSCPFHRTINKLSSFFQIL